MAEDVNTISYDIDWVTFDDYVKCFVDHATSIITQVRNIYAELDKTVLVPDIWYDEHAAAVKDWFEKNKLLDPSFENSIKIIKAVYEETIVKVCAGLNEAQKTTAEGYPNVNSQVRGGTIDFDTKISEVFKDQRTFSGEESKGKKEEIDQMYKNISNSINLLENHSEPLAKRILQLSVKMNYGVNVEGFTPGEARDVSRLTVFAKNLKTVLHDEIEGAASIRNIASKPEQAQ